MAEDFQAPAICGDHWWSSSRSSMLVSVGGLSPCSLGISDLSSWPPPPPADDHFLDIKPKSSAATHLSNSDHHNNNMTFQDYSTFQMMGFALSSSTPTSDHWNQSHDLLYEGGREETNFNSINDLKQEDYNLLEQNHRMNNSINSSSTLLYGYPSSLYDDSDPHQQPPPSSHAQSFFNTTPSINTNSTFPTDPNDLSLSSLTPNFPSNYLKTPHPHPVSAAPLHFTNNAPFWNANSSTDIPQGIASLLERNNNPKSQNISSLPLKPINSANCEDDEEQKKNEKSNAVESPVFKRPRIETPSPLPTFKVRKEKLGDRVTALQQLVSPFGKTDTASVLHEAIEYIKFLHDQVSVLSTPYMKSNNGITLPQAQHQQVCEKKDIDSPNQDLRSRGLCLVPISSTFPVTNATTVDFWTPTFGGSFR